MNTAPAIPATTQEALTPEQMEFSWLVPYNKHLLRVDEAARVLGDRSPDFIRDLVESGQLEAHAQGSRDRSFLRVTKRSVVVYHCRTATYRSRDLARPLAEAACTFPDDLRAEIAGTILRSLTPDQRTDLLKRIGGAA